MKPFEIYAQAHPAEVSSSYVVDGVEIRTISTNVFGSSDNPLGPRVKRTVDSLAQLEPFAAEIAAAFGKPCCVWIGMADPHARKPRGFADAAETVSKVFRNAPAPASAAAVAS